MAADDKKPYYQTWWFWTIAVLAVLFVVGGGLGYRYRPRIVAAWRRRFPGRRPALARPAVVL